MKLSPQTHGPVTLSNIDYAANLSQETFAFTALVSISVNGKTLRSAVMNEGHGGSNRIWDAATEAAIETYAKTLPDTETCSIVLKMDAELLVSEMVSAALIANDLKRALAKKTLLRKGDGKLYEYKGKISDATRKTLVQDAHVVILNDLPFPEALAIYSAMGDAQV